jgi:hypothetical protein
MEWPLLAQSGRTGNAVLDAACLHHASDRRVFVAILGLGAAARDPRAQRQQYPYCREWGGDRRYRFPCHRLCWPLIWPRSKPNQSVGSSDPFEAGRIICAEMALCEFRQDILHSFTGIGQGEIAGRNNRRRQEQRRFD